MRYYIEGTEAIILTIQAIHAEKIYSGKKIFELRKVIPSTPPEIVFLYEQNGSRSITGAFIVKKILTFPLNSLWKLVGPKGTTKDRFYEYFKGYTKGNAYEIEEVIKFENPIYYDRIIDIAPNFSHPQSFLYLKSFPKLKEKLFLELNKYSMRKGIEISFAKPTIYEEDQFKKLAMQEISKKYDEIDSSFVDNIVICSRLGIDPSGYFTSRKILFSIKLSKKTIGYTVITEKIGNSVKTGPTILLSEFRNLGIGRQVRRQIEEIYHKLGYRKLYCTCNATDFSVIRYLIKSGMKVEAHLSSQYKKGNSEFIFGKLLKNNEKVYPKFNRKKIQAHNVNIHLKKDNSLIVDFLLKYFKYYYFEIESGFVTKLLKSTRLKIGKYTQKTKVIFTSKTDDGAIHSISICSPKRGGAVKINFISNTTDQKSFQNLFSSIFN
jgi:predicted transcriptional regulator